MFLTPYELVLQPSLTDCRDDEPDFAHPSSVFARPDRPFAKPPTSPLSRHKDTNMLQLAKAQALKCGKRDGRVRPFISCMSVCMCLHQECTFLWCGWRRALHPPAATPRLCGGKRP